MNKSDLSRNKYMLKGPLANEGYDWWWHSFTGCHKETGAEKAFFIEYFVINPQLNTEEVVLGQLPENKSEHKKPSYVMVKVGTWGVDKKQIHNFYPICEMQIAKDKLELSVGNCFLSETKMSGEVVLQAEEASAHPEYMSDAGTMKWDLSIDKQIAFHVGYGTSELLRELNAFEMFWHAEGMKTQYEGTVILDGEEYDVIPEKSYGYADKNWGANYTSPWVWISSCNLKSLITGMQLENSAIDVGGGRPKVFGMPLDGKVLIDFFYEGIDYEFNFSKFWTFTRTKFKCYETDKYIVWKIKTQNLEARLELICKCKKEDMLLINYEAPDGTKLHNRLWNGGTGNGNIKLYKKEQGKFKLLDDVEMRNVGCEYGEYQ